MKIDSIRIYAEVLEQGIDFKEYLQSVGIVCPIHNVYTKKAHGEIIERDSLVSRIRKSKDVDVLITAISNDTEFPLLMVEYSTAVPTDDHKMQRSDVYYWGAVYKTPIMKIYPSNKGMNQKFGGGNKITDNDEIVLAKLHGAIFYPIQWHTFKDSDVLDTKPNALSCIAKNNEIKAILSQLVKCFNVNATIDSFYDSLLSDYEQKYSSVLEQHNSNNVKSLLVNSTRFHWDNDNLTVKINRFGHAMDPDRGVLFFVNMLVGAEHTVTEIQVNRSSVFTARGGYASLFDALSREKELSSYVQNLIRTQNNIFSDENALHIFTTALNLPTSLFTKASSSKYTIDDAISKSVADAHKLNELIKDNEKLKGLSVLYKKATGQEASLSLNIGIGAKYSPVPPAMNVDYIFMFRIDDSYPQKTLVNYSAAIVNTKLVKAFETLADTDGRLIGHLELDKVYVVK